jgi:hypothetical protein
MTPKILREIEIQQSEVVLEKEVERELGVEELDETLAEGE